MILKKILSIVFVFGLLISNTAAYEDSHDKLNTFDVEGISFTGSTKTFSMTAMDVVSDSVISIFRALKEISFPILRASCYNDRAARSGTGSSLHKDGLAIDINYPMNPYIDIVNRVMIPTRKESREEDEETIRKELIKKEFPEDEIEAIIKVVIQPEGYDDRFLNRNVIRPGMVTPEVVEIFKRNGFSIWGGTWLQPTDYMHFQVPHEVAELLLNAPDKKTREKIWSEHIASCRRK